MDNLGKVLRVNLTEGTVRSESLCEKTVRNFIGGRGYATKVLYDEVPKGTDPLSPANKLIFANGPLTGKGAPSAGRYMVITKSPLTGYIASSNSGGFWGAELARAGWFMIILEGKSPKPVYLWVRDDKVEIRDAGAIWGKDGHEATDDLLAAVGDGQAKVACIGTAGEQLSVIAAIMNDKTRAAGRSGVGAVMGSKNLKGIVVRGSARPPVQDAEGMKAALASSMEKLKTNPVTSQGLPTYGTAVLVNVINQTGGYPMNNWQGAYFPEADEQSGETLARDFLVKRYSCFGCPIGCGRVTKLGEKIGEGPEYETIFAFGVCCGVARLEPIIEANNICNELGLDTISAGVTIAAAMELYEKGYIRKEELEGGPELRFGNGDAVTYWTRKMGLGEGFGKKIGRGILPALRNVRPPGVLHDGKKAGDARLRRKGHPGNRPELRNLQPRRMPRERLHHFARNPWPSREAGPNRHRVQTRVGFHLPEPHRRHRRLGDVPLHVLRPWGG